MEFTLADYNLSKDIYISKEVEYAMRNKWEPLLFSNDGHVFMELVKDDLIFRVISKGPVVLKNIRNGNILENEDSEKIRQAFITGKIKEYSIEVKNNISFEVLKIQSYLSEESVVAKTVHLDDDFYPGTTMPIVVSNFLKKVQKTYRNFLMNEKLNEK